MRGGGQNLQFWPISRCISVTVPRLLLITNKKSYTGSRLPPISMTLDDLERLNREFLLIFLAILAAKHFSRANCAETN